MARKVFFSFQYSPDNWRTSQVRNIGAIEGNQEVSDNDWETIKKGGDAAIEKWIANQMKGRDCTIVLIGKDTAGRKWINHEIKESWNAEMGVLGIRIHNLKHHDGEQCVAGANPFDYVSLGATKLSSIVKVYDPPYNISTNVYDYIKTNIATWVEDAIAIRKKY